MSPIYQAKCRNSLISLPSILPYELALARSLSSLAWRAIALIRRNCALLVPPSNPPLLRPRRPAIQITEQKRTRCTSVAVTEAEAFMQRYWIITPPPPPPTLQSVFRGMAFDTQSKVLSKWLSVICNATFRHPVRVHERRGRCK